MSSTLRRMLAGTVLLMVGLLPFLAQADGGQRQDVIARLAQAEKLGLGGDLDAAISAYQGLVDDGFDAGEVRYNLGTLHLRQGHVGPATLHLLAASRLLPGDGDVAFNLDLARRMRTDQLLDEDVAPQFSGQRLLIIPPHLLEWFHLLLTALALLLLASLPFVEKGRRMMAVMLVFFSLTAVGTGVLGQLRMSAEQALWAVIVVPESAAREGPTAKAASTFTGHAGLFGPVVEEDGAFFRVRLENGVDAWLDGADLGFFGPTEKR